MYYDSELVFEKAFVEYLLTRGWQKVIKNPTEEDLIKNFAEIIYDNNKETDLLNGCPLTDSEINQIITTINNIGSSIEHNRFINGCFVEIVRDNKKDTLHFGKTVVLKIFDKDSIGGGSSVYQIAEQPQFKTNNSAYPDKRGDVMLLINGMPLIHIELKRSNVNVTQAEEQIKKYSELNCFSGLFSLVQIFVAMNPDEAVYFANPGKGGKFNPDFYFHWEDFNNQIVNDWREFSRQVLSIPEAHQFISYYTVADKGDGVLKVMRSYQLFATKEIFKSAMQHDWSGNKQCGGFVWHTTGSGKTMTSFKAAQLIAASNKVDKVLFLIDRIELGNQSYESYNNYAASNEKIQETEDTRMLIGKLLSKDSNDCLIVTSIQKMSRINEDGVIHQKDLNRIQNKKIVFIVDECHRDQKGEMHQIIKKTFPNALFFGFTGTPDHKVTSDIFGDELHRYTILHGVRDKNVLGFDPYFINTFENVQTREEIAYRYCGTNDIDQIKLDRTKWDLYVRITRDATDEEIEDMIPDTQYFTDDKDDLNLSNSHTESVVEDILKKWNVRSDASLFHALFTVDSINKAIKYYKLFKKKNSKISVTALFDPSEGNGPNSIFKMNGVEEILCDYNSKFHTVFNVATYQNFKKDLCDRLSHKNAYKNIKEDEQINLVIVVNQLLTGFDSKWINSLYIDRYDLLGMNLIQAISRTNRIYNFKEKPFGSLFFYCRPLRMKGTLDKAIGAYSGDKPFAIYADKLEKNLNSMNESFLAIKDLFESENIHNFEKNSDDMDWRKKFAKTFMQFNNHMNAAKIQGFNWDTSEYKFSTGGKEIIVKMELDEQTYLVLVQRYKELFKKDPTDPLKEPPFPLDPHIIENKGDKIDYNYMNSRWKQFLKDLNSGDKAAKEKAENDLHKSFSILSQEEQFYAEQILIDINNGSFIAETGKELKDYIDEYIKRDHDKQINILADGLGIDVNQLRKLMEMHVNDATINNFGYYDKLKEGIDIAKAKTFLEKRLNTTLVPRKVYSEADKLLRDFIIKGGYTL